MSDQQNNLAGGPATIRTYLCDDQGDFALFAVDEVGESGCLNFCDVDDKETPYGRMLREIDRRVNLHDELVRELQTMAAFFRSVRPGGGILSSDPDIDSTEALIARAQGVRG